MLLEINGLRASRAGIEVLDDVWMHLDRGEIYGLLGPNGAGKSTTIAVILGLLARQGGEVAVFGADPASVGPAVRTRLGVLPERNGFYEWDDDTGLPGVLCRPAWNRAWPERLHPAPGARGSRHLRG